MTRHGDNCVPTSMKSADGQRNVFLPGCNQRACAAFRKVRGVLVGPLLAGCLMLRLGASLHAAPADTTDPHPRDFTSFSLEELMNYPVTSVSRHAERLVDAPAAIFVITPEDLRRSGVTSIPEALRLVPGLQVARIDSHDWAISARGFNDGFANKLLVLMDGRSLYTPLFSGVFWDVQDTMLEDIERIEVVRGPGATLWGANAVNGVINIITKSARETAVAGEKFLITTGGGTEEQGFAGVRYSDFIGERTAFRIYSKYFNRDDTVLPSGGEGHDRWRMGRAGFRLDWGDRAGPAQSDLNVLTLQGDIYEGRMNQVFNVPTPRPPYLARIKDQEKVSGGNILGRWSHEFSDASGVQLQLYYDRTSRKTAIFGEDRDTFDVDVQHRFQLGQRHDLVWGAGYRVSADEVDNTFSIALDPDNRTTQLFSAFVQDQILLQPDRWSLTLGTKLEHNDFTGFELQPSARLLWTPTERQSVWASVSRAVRTPSRAEDDVHLSVLTPMPGVISSVRGARAFESEELLAYELGYRLQPHTRLSFDVALFYNTYDELRSLEPQPFVPGPPPVYVPMVSANKFRGETCGVEITPQWQVTDGWRLQAGYSYLRMRLRPEGGSLDQTTAEEEGRNPRHQFNLRSSLDLPHNVQLDAWLRYVDDLPALDVPDYFTLDLRLGWRPRKHLELAIVGQNLLAARHAEFRSSLINTTAAEIERSVYGKITWRF